MKTTGKAGFSRIRLLALVGSADAADEVRAALGGQPGLVLDVRVEPRAAAAERIRALAPDALLLEIDDTGDIKALDQLAPLMSRTPVIAMARRVDLETAKRLMRLGFMDVLLRPLDPDDARAAIEAVRPKVQQVQHENRSRGVVAAFMGSSGGAGTTTLAVETAVALMGDKVRHKTCVLDFDLQFGNIALGLDLPASSGLMQILEAPERLDLAFLEGATVAHKSGLHVLAAPSSIVPIDALSAETAIRVIELSRDCYEFSVIDMPHAWSAWTAPTLARADLIVLVTELNVVALHRARRQISLLHEQGLEAAPLVVVANRFEKSWSTRGTLKQAEAALGHSIDHCIRPDTATVTAARDQGMPLREIKRGSKVEKDLAPLCAEIREMRKVEPVLHAFA